jgi:signal transduction histidine kinase
VDLLNGAVAAFAHRAISERNPGMLAAEALAYLAAGLEAERTELWVISADGQSLELLHRFPAPRIAAAETIAARGPSMAAEAYARRGVAMRADGAATAVECDGRVCVFVAWSRDRPFPEEARNGVDAFAAMYAAAVARNSAEAQLADRESRLRLILDQIPAIVSTLDPNLVFTSAAGAGMAAVPPDAAAMVGCTLAEVIGSDETGLPVVSARNVLAGIPMRYEWTWQGRTYENRMEPLRDAEGNIVGVINLGFDVTERRRDEVALHESREELRRLSAAMHELEENQRRGIAREIHDDLGQRLTALRLDVGLLRTELREGRPAAAEERTALMLELIDETLTTARRVAMELRPAILDDFGFAAAIEHEADSFARRSGIDVALHLEPKALAIEGARATALYRVIQEALTNVARHSGAARVEVRVEKREGFIEAEVRDFGRGISDAELSSSSALGLIGIRERIYAFDGHVAIERVNGEGTRVLVRVPDEDPRRG